MRAFAHPTERAFHAGVIERPAPAARRSFQRRGSTTMLAEIFLLRLEAMRRETEKDRTTTTSDMRFVPITPRA